MACQKSSFRPQARLRRRITKNKIFKLRRTRQRDTTLERAKSVQTHKIFRRHNRATPHEPTMHPLVYAQRFGEHSSAQIRRHETVSQKETAMQNAQCCLLKCRLVVLVVYRFPFVFHVQALLRKRHGVRRHIRRGVLSGRPLLTVHGEKPSLAGGQSSRYSAPSPESGMCASKGMECIATRIRTYTEDDRGPHLFTNNKR